MKILKELENILNFENVFSMEEKIRKKSIKDFLMILHSTIIKTAKSIKKF